MNFDVIQGTSLNSRWANLRLNQASGLCTVAAIWEGPTYDVDLDALRFNCRELNRLLKGSVEISERSHRLFEPCIRER